MDAASAAPETPTAAAGGLLVVLVPEARATTAFRLHTFTGADDAAAFIRRWFRPQASGAVIVFWALHERPLMEPGSGEPEAIALVREGEGSDIVFFSSFSDMHSARSLVRAKVERGLDLGQTLIYWAAPVTIDYRKPGVVHLTPATPPSVQGEAVRQLPLLPQERDREHRTVGLPEAPADTPVPALDPLDRTAELTDGAPPEPSPLAPTYVEETSEVTVEAPEPSVPALDGFDGTAEVTAGAPPEPSPPAPVDSEEAAELTVEAQKPPVPALDGFDWTAEVTAGAPPEPSPPAPVDSEEAAELTVEAPEPSVPALDGFDWTAEMTAGDAAEPSTVVPDDDTAEAGAEPVATDDASEERPDVEAEDEEEVEVVPTERLVFEVEKVLRVNRWDEREGPFRGFGSPPGKF